MFISWAEEFEECDTVAVFKHVKNYIFVANYELFQFSLNLFYGNEEHGERDKKG